MDQVVLICYAQVNPLLDLKQKYASVFEARFARQQATAAAQQGQTIMVFTIVTIIFVRLFLPHLLLGLSVPMFQYSSTY